MVIWNRQRSNNAIRFLPKDFPRAEKSPVPAFGLQILRPEEHPEPDRQSLHAQGARLPELALLAMGLQSHEPPQICAYPRSADPCVSGGFHRRHDSLLPAQPSHTLRIRQHELTPLLFCKRSTSFPVFGISPQPSETYFLWR